MRNHQDIASVLAAISPTMKFHALKIKREIERDIPEMREKLLAHGDDRFIVEFDRHVRSCVEWQERTFPIVGFLALILLSAGLFMQRELYWFLLSALYVCVLALVAERYMKRFIELKCRRFYGRFIDFDKIVADLAAETEGDDSARR